MVLTSISSFNLTLKRKNVLSLKKQHVNTYQGNKKEKVI